MARPCPSPPPATCVYTTCSSTRFSRTPATGGEVRGPKGKKGGEGRLDNGSSRETNSISDARVPTDLSRAKTSGQTSVDVSNVPSSLSLSFFLLVIERTWLIFVDGPLTGRKRDDKKALPWLSRMRESIRRIYRGWRVSRLILNV